MISGRVEQSLREGMNHSYRPDIMVACTVAINTFDGEDQADEKTGLQEVRDMKY